MSEEPKPRRRWLRYSLRTLFVVVTVFGCWLGVQVKWIRDRREFLAVDNVAHLAGRYNVIHFPSGQYHIGVQQADESKAPGILWLLGEHGVGIISIAPDGEALIDEQIEHGRRLFPEAQVNSTEAGS